MSGRKVASGSGGGGAGPDLKRRKLLDAGGPIEDDETARQKMRDARVYERGVRGTRGEFVGFDPDNIGDIKCLNCANVTAGFIKPMAYFAREGDLPMMRWLYVNGADTRDEEVAHWFPMMAAAKNGRMDMCKWLFTHGAAEDTKKRTHNYNRSPLISAFETLTPSFAT